MNTFKGPKEISRILRRSNGRLQTKTEFNGKVPSRVKDMKSKLLYFKSDVLDIDSFKNRWIDKNSKKKNLPKLMDEIYYEEN